MDSYILCRWVSFVLLYCNPWRNSQFLQSLTAFFVLYRIFLYIYPVIVKVSIHQPISICSVYSYVQISLTELGFRLLIDFFRGKDVGGSGGVGLWCGIGAGFGWIWAFSLSRCAIAKKITSSLLIRLFELLHRLVITYVYGRWGCNLGWTFACLYSMVPFPKHLSRPL